MELLLSLWIKIKIKIKIVEGMAYIENAMEFVGSLLSNPSVTSTSHWASVELQKVSQRWLFLWISPKGLFFHQFICSIFEAVHNLQLYCNAESQASLWSVPQITSFCLSWMYHLPRKIVDAPSLEVFSVRLDGALCNQPMQSTPSKGVGTRWSLRLLST